MKEISGQEQDHPSDPGPLPGHPEAMKIEPPPRLFSHQCVEGGFSEVGEQVFCEVRFSLLESLAVHWKFIATCFQPTWHGVTSRTLPVLA
jgi:hypothetical protein